MLRTVDSVNGYAIRTTDDELGHVKEAYFDDEKWVIRYLVVETGSWLSKRRVLISPYSVDEIDDSDECVHVTLSRDQLKNSPDIDTHKPISRQQEHEYSHYFGYGAYWGGPFLWGNAAYPNMPITGVNPSGPRGSLAPSEVRPEASAASMASEEDVHLRSSDQVSGYNILGTDHDIGHIKDFIFDDEDWAIRYVLVDTRNWWPGGDEVVLATQWIQHIDWSDSTAQTTLTRDQIKDSPKYDEDVPLDRNYETRLHQFYDQKAYWE